MRSRKRKMVLFGVFMGCVLSIGGMGYHQYAKRFDAQERKVSSTDDQQNKDDTNNLHTVEEKQKTNTQDRVNELGSDKDAKKKASNEVFTQPAMRVQLPLAQRIQETNYYCIPTCLQMVIKYKKNLDVQQNVLAQEMKTKPVTGTEYIDFLRVANKYLFHKEKIGSNEPGYRIQTLARYDKDPHIATIFEQRVKQDMSSNDPVFVGVDLKALYPNLATVNHWIVLIGYTLKEGTQTIEYFYYIDPYYAVQDPQFGGLKKVTKEKLLYAIVANDEPAYIW